MPNLNLDTATREELIAEVQRLKAVEDGIAKLKSLHMEGGEMDMKLEFQPEVREQMIRNLAAMVADAPNYTETSLEFRPKRADGSDWIVVIVQKGSGKSPHQLRTEAEFELTKVKAEAEKSKSYAREGWKLVSKLSSEKTRLTDENQKLVTGLREAYDFIKEKFDQYAAEMKKLSPDEQFYGEDLSWGKMFKVANYLLPYPEYPYKKTVQETVPNSGSMPD